MLYKLLFFRKTTVVHTELQLNWNLKLFPGLKYSCHEAWCYHLTGTAWHEAEADTSTWGRYLPCKAWTVHTVLWWVLLNAFLLSLVDTYHMAK